MRTRSVCWGVVMCALFAGSSKAQTPVGPTTYPVEMTIIVPEVEVRSGPTKLYYPTAKMHQGERVTVLRECKDQPGWSAIKPPPGSFSWIREKFVKQIDARNGFVQAPGNAPVPVMPASSMELPTLNVESAKVPSGSALVILDKPCHRDGENWLPIQTTAEEVRFIPTSAVRLPAPAVAVAAGFPTTVGGDQLARADQAYRAGNVELAKQLYRQIADKGAEPQKSTALNRLATLQASGAAPVSANHSNWQPIAPIGAQPQSVSPPPATTPAGNPVAAQTISNYTVPGTNMTAVQASQWSRWGYLRRAAFPDKDGQAVYVLENSQRQPMMYVLEQPGSRVMLQKMVGRLICLYGPIAYWSDEFPRIQYMVASWYATP